MKQKAEQLIEQLKTLISDLWQTISSSEAQEKQKQIQAVNKSIRDMEKHGVTIPGEIRNLKTKLINELSEVEQSSKILNFITNELVILLKEIGITANSSKTTRISVKRETAIKTEQSVLREYIIKALKFHGGKASMDNVLEWMEEKLRDKFTPRDLSKRKWGEIVWRNNTAWERFQMIKDGILKSDSRRGVWELSEEYK